MLQRLLVWRLLGSVREAMRLQCAQTAVDLAKDLLNCLEGRDNALTCSDKSARRHGSWYTLTRRQMFGVQAKVFRHPGDHNKAFRE